MSNDINETMHGIYKYGHALINSDLGYQQWDSKYITRNIKLRHISLLLFRNLFMKKDQIKLKICVMDIISKTLEGCQFSSLGGYKNDAKLYVL